jgi:hypothetical protein
MAQARAAVALLGLAVVIAASAPEARAETRPWVLPIPSGQTWYVCQGYNGQVTHDGIVALDLSRDPDSVGTRGCMSGSRYSSAGAVVSSPAAGTAYRWPGCCGQDFVCVNLDSGGSVALGHLSNRVDDGTRVATGDPVGTVAWPTPSNGDYAHIHIQVHAASNCTEAGPPVAFDEAHGFRWACVPDLPYSGTPNQYSGLAVERCGSFQQREPKLVADDDARDRETVWMMRSVIRSVELLMSFVTNY